MKTKIPEDIVNVVDATLDTLQVIAEQRQNSAALLAAAIGEIRFMITPPEEEPSDWIEPPSETSPEAPDGPQCPECPCDNCTCEKGRDEAGNDLREDSEETDHKESIAAAQRLLSNIQRVIRERNTDGYAIAKNRKLETAEIDIWEALDDMVSSLLDGDMNIQKLLLNSVMRINRGARN